MMGVRILCPGKPTDTASFIRPKQALAMKSQWMDILVRATKARLLPLSPPSLLLRLTEQVPVEQHLTECMCSHLQRCHVCHEQGKSENVPHQEEPKKTPQLSLTWNLRLVVLKNPLQSRLFCKSETCHKCLLYILGSLARGTKQGFERSQREPYFSGEDMPQNSTQIYQIWFRGVEKQGVSTHLQLNK